MHRKIMKVTFSCIMLLSILFNGCSKAPQVTGELKKWHTVTLTFDGPETSETAQPNPFLYYRFDVTFTQGEKTYVVPGYFAADGDAANTSAESGNQWRVHFTPDAVGEWRYEVSFKQGEHAAVSDDADAFESAGFMDGITGSFEIVESDKESPDLRSKGRLNYVGKRYLQFAETGEYFLKCGADAPENLLAYADFDGDFKTDGHKDDLIKTWDPHVKDWQEGDPVWQDGKGKGLIGAINYLASEGMNVFSFLTMNIGGDDRNVFPYISYDNYERMDVSRLDQWGIVLTHGARKGMYLHFKTQESENECLLDGGDVGIQRKLVYRELIARFGHYLALNWNMGEENGIWGEGKEKYQTTKQRLAMARYFYENDPYRHHVVIHNGQSFDDVLGPDSKYTGASLQTHKEDFSIVQREVLRWLEASEQAGKQWVVAVDEPGDHRFSLVPDKVDPAHDNARKHGLWSALLSGAAGLEWYFGYEHDHSDLTCEDWRSRDLFWDQCRIALNFFKTQKIPFWEMTNGDDLLYTEEDVCFYKENEIYIVYLKNGGRTVLNLGNASGLFHINWFDPLAGVFSDNSQTISGGSRVRIKSSDGPENKDWIALIRK